MNIQNEDEIDSKPEIDEQQLVSCTSDLYYAAYLLAQGYELRDADRTNSSRVVFRFQYTDRLKSEYHRYFFGGSMIRTNDYVSALKKLKTLLYLEGY